MAQKLKFQWEAFGLETIVPRNGNLLGRGFLKADDCLIIQRVSLFHQALSKAPRRFLRGFPRKVWELYPGDFLRMNLKG